MNVRIFDTTLRDGEQTIGVSLSPGSSSGVSDVTFAMLEMMVPSWTLFTVTTIVIISNAWFTIFPRFHVRS